MVHHKRLVFILAAGFILMSLAAVISLLWPEPAVPDTGAVASSKSNQKPALGKPCNYKGEIELETNGLQCYFYGESDEGGYSRPAIWIKPDFRKPMPSIALNKKLEWKDYADKDLGITVPLLTIMEANKETSDKDMPTVVFYYDSNPYLSMERVAKNAVSFEDRMSDTESLGMTMLDENITLANSQEARHLIIYPKDNLSAPYEIWGIDKGDYYLYIHSQIGDDSIMRYAVEYMVANLKINEPIN